MSANPPSLNDILFLSSNQVKINELSRYKLPGLTCGIGEDIKEVEGTPEEVILYKALSAGEGILVEDAIIVVDGVPYIDVRWRIPSFLSGEFNVGAPVSWEVRMGVMHNNHIYTYLGKTEGTIMKAITPGVGVDPIICVTGVGKSMAQLDAEGIKDQYSARYFAAQNVLKQKPHSIHAIASIPEWRGKYQNS